MNYYEILYIIHPALDAGRVKEMVLSVNNTLEKRNGDIASTSVWGKKKLAYEIDKQKYGTYVQLQFTGQGRCTNNFSKELEHNPNILSYLTTIINEIDVIEQKNDLDTQIAGQSRETQEDKSKKVESSEVSESNDGDNNPIDPNEAHGRRENKVRVEKVLRCPDGSPRSSAAPNGRHQKRIRRGNVRLLHAHGRLRHG